MEPPASKFNQSIGFSGSARFQRAPFGILPNVGWLRNRQPNPHKTNV
jgi:hypothetical protein